MRSRPLNLERTCKPNLPGAAEGYIIFLMKKGHGRDNKIQRASAAAERHGRVVERVGFISYD